MEFRTMGPSALDPNLPPGSSALPLGSLGHVPPEFRTTAPAGSGPLFRTMVPPGSMGPPLGSMGPPLGSMGPSGSMGPPPGSMGPPLGFMGPPLAPPGPVAAGPPLLPPGSLGSMPVPPEFRTMPTGALPASPPSVIGPLGSVGPAPVPAVPYSVVAHQVAERLDQAVQRRGGLLTDLDLLTNGEYNRGVKNALSMSHRAQLDSVDWRVPRLVFAKDPKFNEGLDPRFAFEVQQRKLADGSLLEATLSAEAEARWLERWGEPFQQAEFRSQQAVPFVEATPNFKPEEDVWTRRLELRTLDEAMRGDVSKPMPRPSVFGEDYQNYREGKYVKDDCPIA